MKLTRKEIASQAASAIMDDLMSRPIVAASHVLVLDAWRAIIINAMEQPAHTPEDAAIENEATGLIKKYGLFLPAPAKEFFRKLADHLKWNNLKEQIK
jgi:hypothetical protein